MKIQLVSDIHLEFFKENNFEIPSGEVLVLAGDIGYPKLKVYQDFLKQMSTQFEIIFLIAGNHEYYMSNSIKETENIIKDFVSTLPNIIFLQKSSYLYKGVKFIGCTLWSNPTNKLLTFYMNDFECIPRMTFEKYNLLHKDHQEWLKMQINETKEPKIVITHHLPTDKLVADKYKNHRLNEFFYSDQEELMSNVNLWLCGHSHYAKSIQIGKCRAYCNPVGYKHEKTEYDKNLVIEF